MNLPNNPINNPINGSGNGNVNNPLNSISNGNNPLENPINSIKDIDFSKIDLPIPEIPSFSDLIDKEIQKSGCSFVNFILNFFIITKFIFCFFIIIFFILISNYLILFFDNSDIIVRIFSLLLFNLASFSCIKILNNNNIETSFIKTKYENYEECDNFINDFVTSSKFLNYSIITSIILSVILLLLYLFISDIFN